jgi:hypothetical protein
MTLYDSLNSNFASYRTADVLGSVAALQLFPENSQHLLRLEFAAAGAAQIPDDPALPNISRNRLLNILQTEPLRGTVSRLEDPPEYPFVESIDFHGGSYRVYSGLTGGLSHHTSAIIEALLHPSSSGRSAPK